MPNDPDLLPLPKNREALLNGLLLMVPEAILCVDSDHRILTFNPGAEAIFGYAATEMIGAPLESLVPPQFRSLHAAHMRKFGTGAAQSRTMGQRGEIRGLRRSGEEFPAEASISWLPDGDGGIFTIILRDVTERRNAEEALREREAQLRQAQKMEAVGRLAGGVAHDFNNLLGVINGYSELCLMRPELPEPLRELVLDIQSAADRAAVLTRQLLTFSRRQAAEPAVLDLGEVVQGLERLLRRLIGEDVRLRTTCEPDLPRIRADAGQMEQVLMNLAINARDAMPQGGQLEIHTGRGEQQFSADSPLQEAVVLTVRDSGCGIDPETRARIFEPFFTTKPEGEGTGLGLFTVYGVVAQSGGSIQVESEIGRGTVFRIAFPAVEDGKPEIPAAPERTLLKGSECVLVVEDEEMLRDLVTEILQGAGYQVLSAADPEDAVKRAAETAAPIHLLLTDVVMPGLSGREVAEAVVAHHPGLQVVYMSGYQARDVQRHGIGRPEMQLLQKPFTPTALLRKVRETLDAGEGGPGAETTSSTG